MKSPTLKDWEDTFACDELALSRIKRYRNSYNYAMEIVEFQETTKITLSQLREEIDNFVVPQMYYYLDGKPLLSYIEKNIEYKNINVKHTFETIDSNKVCVH